MKRQSLRLWSTTAIAAAMLATPAFAQDTTQATADPAAPQAQDAPVLTTGQPSETGEAIVVTGLRRSLQSGQNIKRNSTQQIDAIVAEDIGKLPDITVSDTAARIPGIQVERGGGEAGRVLVRGLDRDYYTTTYNGREIFTAETRSVALQDFPAGGIAALEAFKTSTADLVEGGIAGLINVRSRRPFDFSGPQVAGSFWLQKEKRSGKVDPNGNLLLTDRWGAGEGEFGALINFSYTQLQYLDSTRSNTDFVATPNINGEDVRFPDIERLTYGVGKRSRPSINGSLQWRPHPGLEFYFDGIWQGFRNEVSDRELSVPLYGRNPNIAPIDTLPTSYTDVVLEGGSNLVDSLTAVYPHRPDMFQGATYGKTDTYQFAAGGKYNSGPFNLTADLARTTSTFLDSIYSFDEAFRNQQIVTANPSQATFDFANFNPSDPNNYVYRGFFDRQLIAKGDDYQARVDGSYDFGNGFLNQFQAGFRWVDRNAHFEDGSRYNYREPDQLALSAVPGVEYDLFRSGFPSSDPQQFRTWLAPTYESIRNSIADLRQFSGFAAGPPPPDPRASYSAEEKSYAGYGQLHYAFGDDAGVHVDGAVGVRVVHTNLDVSGTAAIAGVNTSVEVRREYTDWLPNASARIHFNEQLQLRLSAARTRTRPALSQYNPGRSVDPPPSCEQNDTNCIRNANGGNPYLNPIKSTNLDASLEYYFSRTGFASAAVFRRDIDGFVQNSVQFVNDPDYGLIQLNAPFNTSKGHINGFEGQFRTFFDFGSVPTWLRSFGVEANVTYLDTSLRYPAPGNPVVDYDHEIVGVSKWTYNLDAFYEHGGLSARLSYNHRSSFLFEPFCCGPYRPDYNFFNGQDPNARLFVDRARPVGRLDFSASYDITPWLTFTVDATNITAKPLRVDETTYNTGLTNPAAFPRSIRYEESVYSAGIRFRFGGSRRPAPIEPPVVLPPPSLPPVEPAPVVEQPAPPPPPPPATPERG